MSENKSPVTVLPEDEARKEKLRRKLEEYKGRLDGFRAPELQMDTICKIAVLGKILKDGEVNTWDLSRELSARYGSSYDPYAFNVACDVVEDYIKIGGVNLRGGTGLK